MVKFLISSSVIIFSGMFLIILLIKVCELAGLDLQCYEEKKINPDSG